MCQKESNGKETGVEILFGLRKMELLLLYVIAYIGCAVLLFYKINGIKPRWKKIVWFLATIFAAPLIVTFGLSLDVMEWIERTSTWLKIERKWFELKRWLCE